MSHCFLIVLLRYLLLGEQFVQSGHFAAELLISGGEAVLLPDLLPLLLRFLGKFGFYLFLCFLVCQFYTHKFLVVILCVLQGCLIVTFQRQQL